MVSKNFPLNSQPVLATVFSKKEGTSYEILHYQKNRWFNGKKKCRALVLAYRAINAYPETKFRHVYEVDDFDPLSLELGKGCTVYFDGQSLQTSKVEDFYVSDALSIITTENSIYRIESCI